MANDETLLGNMQEDKGQAAELQEKNPDSIIISSEPKKNIEEKETPKNQGEEETPEKTTETPTQEEEKVEEETEQSDAELLKKRIKDKDSHIGKIENENKTLRESLTKVKQATSPAEKKEAEDELVKAYNDQVKEYVDGGYTEKEAHAYLKPFLKMARATQKVSDNKRVALENEKIMVEVADYLEDSKEFDQVLLDKFSVEIRDEIQTYSPSYLKNNTKKAVKKAYKSVLREQADKARGITKHKDDSAREDMIDTQKSPGAKPRARDASNEITGDDILGAPTGGIQF